MRNVVASGDLQTDELRSQWGYRRPQHWGVRALVQLASGNVLRV